MRSSSDLALWLLSATIGVLGILILFTLGPPGLVLLLLPALIVWTRPGSRGSLKAGGALTGFGSAMLLILAAANTRCAEFSALPNQSCTTPSVTVVSFAAAVVLVVGLILTFRSARTLRST
jgi:hypothetical protein